MLAMIVFGQLVLCLVLVLLYILWDVNPPPSRLRFRVRLVR